MTNNERIEALIVDLVAKSSNSVNVCDLLIDYINTLTDDEVIELLNRNDEIGVVHECDACHYQTLDDTEIYDGGMCCIECKADSDHDGQSGYFRENVIVPVFL